MTGGTGLMAHLPSAVQRRRKTTSGRSLNMPTDQSATGKEAAQSASWLNPFDAGRQWIDLAAKVQTAVTDQITRQARGAMVPPFAPEVVSQAFAHFFAHVLSDPAKLAQAQRHLWER